MPLLGNLKPMIRKNYNKNSGYITLISVLVVGAVSVAIAVSLLLLGLAASRTSHTYQQADQAKALASACAEEGVEQIRTSSAYVGSGALSLGAGTCVYVVTSQGGSNRTINASGTVGGVVRKLSVIINGISPLITVASWQEY